MELFNRGLSRRVVIKNDLGIHARPAAMIAKLAGDAKSDVWIAKGKKWANASSVIDLLALVCPKGEGLSITIDDPSDIDVLNKLIMLVENGFGE
jgi:phosphocarrier protein HPr